MISLRTETGASPPLTLVSSVGKMANCPTDVLWWSPAAGLGSKMLWEALSFQMLLLAPCTDALAVVLFALVGHMIKKPSSNNCLLVIVAESISTGSLNTQILIGFQDAPACHKTVQSDLSLLGVRLGPRLNLDLLLALVSYSASLIHLS